MVRIIIKDKKGTDKVIYESTTEHVNKKIEREINKLIKNNTEE